MKVLYDVSVFGSSLIYQTSRTGIFRVVDNLADNLIQRNDCEIIFCATNDFVTLQKSIECVKQKDGFSQTKFSLPHSIKRKFELNAEIENMWMGSRNGNIKSLPKNDNKTKLFLLRAERKLRHLIYKYTNFIDDMDLKKADIFHSPLSPIPAQIKKAKNKTVFLTSYDLIPILHPQLVEKNTLTFIKNVLDSITPDTWVLCISEATRNDLLNYLGNRVDANKVFVTELAASDMFYKSTDKIKNIEVKQKYNIPNAPYVLSLCTLEPRKNIDQVIRAFAKMLQQENMPDVNLVLVGTKGWMFDKIFEEIDTNNVLQNRIIITGFVPDEDLAAIYSDAMMFVYPSFYEGFGLPPLEAMQCGVPVITSNTSSLPEVVGDAGIMVAPTDLDALCQAMTNIYKSSSLQRQLSEKSIQRAKHFSWERCAKETVAAYKMSLA